MGAKKYFFGALYKNSDVSLSVSPPGRRTVLRSGQAGWHKARAIHRLDEAADVTTWLFALCCLSRLEPTSSSSSLSALDVVEINKCVVLFAFFYL